MKNDWDKAEKILKNDGIGVIPTDTLYGLVGSALSKKAVEKIYKIKERDFEKPLIILISSYRDLKIFGIKVKEKEVKILKKFWPGKISIILDCKKTKWKYLHRGIGSIAFRMVSLKNKNLFNLINKIGPLVAPSANKQSKKPAETIKQAKIYFGSKIDFYINSGIIKSKPSKLVRFEKGKLIILRDGWK